MICILCNKLSFRLGVPSLLLFILLGMVFGSDGLFRIPFENYAFAEKAVYGSPDLYHVLRRLRNTLEAGPAGSPRRRCCYHRWKRISDSGADRCVLSLGDRDGMAGKLF